MHSKELSVSQHHQHQQQPLPPLVFFIDNQKQKQHSIKRVLDCHLYSILNKYITKYKVLISLLNHLPTVLSSPAVSISEFIESLAHECCLQDDHWSCINNGEAANATNTCLLMVGPHVSYSLEALYQQLSGLDDKLKHVLQGGDVLEWVMKKGVLSFLSECSSRY